MSALPGSGRRPKADGGWRGNEWWGSPCRSLTLTLTLTSLLMMKSKK